MPPISNTFYRSLQQWTSHTLLFGVMKLVSESSSENNNVPPMFHSHTMIRLHASFKIFGHSRSSLHGIGMESWSHSLDKSFYDRIVYPSQTFNVLMPESGGEKWDQQHLAVEFPQQFRHIQNESYDKYYVTCTYEEDLGVPLYSFQYVVEFIQ